MPAPGTMVGLSGGFQPPLLKGLKVHPEDPFLFDFILDNGQAKTSSQEEKTNLVKYFLAALTTPEDDMWVNLSPTEKDRIVPQSFGQTQMGRDLLAQDYLLKQLSSSLTNPDTDLGRKYWANVGNGRDRSLQTNTDLTKVWIVPGKAVVYENPETASAYVLSADLKVMMADELEKKSLVPGSSSLVDTNQAPGTNYQEPAYGVFRSLILPQIEKEVNTGKNFAAVRQVYYSLILAAWYKKKIKDSILSQVYVDQNKVAGVNIKDPNEKLKIYEQYLEAFKKGVYSTIKEEYDPVTDDTVPRKYFSGGFSGKFSAGSALTIISDSRIARAASAIDAGELLQVRASSANKDVLRGSSQINQEFDNIRLGGGFRGILNGQEVHIRGVGRDIVRIRNYLHVLRAQKNNGSMIAPVHRVYIPNVELDIEESIKQSGVVLKRRVFDENTSNVIRELKAGVTDGLIELFELNSMNDFELLAREFNFDSTQVVQALTQTSLIMFVSDWVGPDVREYLNSNRSDDEIQYSVGMKLGRTLKNLHRIRIIAADTHLGQFVVRIDTSGNPREVLRIDTINMYSLQEIAEVNVLFEFNGLNKMLIHDGFIKASRGFNDGYNGGDQLSAGSSVTKVSRWPIGAWALAGAILGAMIAWGGYSYSTSQIELQQKNAVAEAFARVNQERVKKFYELLPKEILPGEDTSLEQPASSAETSKKSWDELTEAQKKEMVEKAQGILFNRLLENLFRTGYSFEYAAAVESLRSDFSLDQFEGITKSQDWQSMKDRLRNNIKKPDADHTYNQQLSQWLIIHSGRLVFQSVAGFNDTVFMPINRDGNRFQANLEIEGQLQDLLNQYGAGQAYANLSLGDRNRLLELYDFEANNPNFLPFFLALVNDPSMMEMIRTLENIEAVGYVGWRTLIYQYKGVIALNEFGVVKVMDAQSEIVKWNTAHPIQNISVSVGNLLYILKNGNLPYQEIKNEAPPDNTSPTDSKLPDPGINNSVPTGNTLPTNDSDQNENQSGSSAVGGINFKGDRLNVETKNGRGAIKFQVSPAQMQEWRDAPGFTPVIIHVQPMTNIQMFLGLKENENPVLAASGRS